MKIDNIKNGAFYLATAPYNYNTLVITDVGTYGCLKVLGNSSKYFNGYYPSFHYFNGKSLTKVTTSSLKKDFQNALKVDPKYFSATETEKLCKFFKIKIPMLSAKGWHKEHNNFNKAEKWEKKPKDRKTSARNVEKLKRR
jgi:hypothetical protein